MTRDKFILGRRNKDICLGCLVVTFVWLFAIVSSVRLYISVSVRVQ